MTNVLVILDLNDRELFHTDLGCVEVGNIVDDAERQLGHRVDDPSVLIEHAADLGLIVDSGIASGMRWCRACRMARTIAPHAVAA